MCAEVYKHPHIQTGGNLFGLWTTSGSAVIRLVIGPGQGCRRTKTSFIKIQNMWLVLVALSTTDTCYAISENGVPTTV